MSSEPLLSGKVSGERLELAAAGSWTASNASALEPLIDIHTVNEAPGARALSIDMSKVREFDTFGAWLLERLLRAWKGRGRDAEIVGLPEHYRGLFAEVEETNRKPLLKSARANFVLAALDGVGRSVARVGNNFVPFINMLGAFSTALMRVIVAPRHFRLTSTVHQLDRIGWQAVPIIALITVLIGSIIAQQGFFHFRKLAAGADQYVPDMVGVLAMRELGVLLVAIMIAGRSGSAITAELGAMKMREEIDALRTMGFDPVEVLILPRVLALIIAMPLLTFLGEMAALYGGGLVAWLYGGMSPEIFMERIKAAITTTHFQVGMIKAPFMGAVIGIVAAAEGMRVKGSAESLGQQTTTSVVRSIFLVIVLDGIFAIFFASINM